MELNSELDRLRKFQEKYGLIEKELTKAREKHPNYPQNNMFKQVAIISEEAGEIAQAVLQYYDEGTSLEEVEKELMHTIVTCIRMLEEGITNYPNFHTFEWVE